MPRGQRVKPRRLFFEPASYLNVLLSLNLYTIPLPKNNDNAVGSPLLKALINNTTIRRSLILEVNA